MKLQFKAKGTPQPDYDMSGTAINGVDLSQFPHGGEFILTEEMREKGIYNVEYDGDELLVTIAQTVISSQMEGRMAAWRGCKEQIESSQYEPNKCYVCPTGVDDLKQGKDYVIVKGTDCAGVEGWTIKGVSKDD